MNLQEAAQRVKIILNQEIAPNTLRKACATGRLRGVRKGAGSMHIRRTEWDVVEEDVIQFVREEYHARPSRRGKKQNELHIPKRFPLTETQNNKDKNEVEEANEAKVFYRVIEHIFQRTLPIHGERMEKYDTRIIESKIRSRVNAEALVQKLQAEAQAKELSDQLQYGIETYTPPKVK